MPPKGHRRPLFVLFRRKFTSTRQSAVGAMADQQVRVPYSRLCVRKHVAVYQSDTRDVSADREGVPEAEGREPGVRFMIVASVVVDRLASGCMGHTLPFWDRIPSISSLWDVACASCLFQRSAVRAGASSVSRWSR